MGPKVKSGIFVVCERPEVPGENFLGKIAQYTPGDPHCYLIEYLIEKNNRLKRINNEYVVEVDKLTIIPKDSFCTIGSKTTVRARSEITKLLNSRLNELSPTEEGKPVKSKRKKKLPGENRRKRKKNEEEEEEDFEISDEGEWEVYKPELWESSDFVVAEVIHQASSTVATTIPTSAIVESSHTSSVTENTTVEKITSESTLEVNHKPQRKTRIARESKRELKADTSRIDVLCAPPSTSALRHQLPGIVSCPNKRYKGVVEIKGKTYAVPGLFDSDVEAAVARDEYLVRKFDSTRQTTFCVDQSGLLFYGYGLQDPPSLMLKRKESEPRSRTQDKLLEGSSELEPPLSAIQPTSSSLQSSVRCQWWWDQLVMNHFLKESADSGNHGS